MSAGILSLVLVSPEQLGSFNKVALGFIFSLCLLFAAMLMLETVGKCASFLGI